jgi:hypothetical protein
VDISIDHFAQRMCYDLNLSARQFAPLIAKYTRDQLAEFSPFLGTSITEDMRVLIKVNIYIIHPLFVQRRPKCDDHDECYWDM